MDHLPIQLPVKGAPSLVVGGGSVASRKVRLLLRAGAHVRVLAPHHSEDLHQWRAALPPEAAAEARLELVPAAFTPEALTSDLALVVAATDDEETNRSVSREALRRGVPVNVVDEPALSSFLIPAVVDRGPVTVAIGTGGAAPVLARRLRARIEALLPANLGDLAELAGRWRQRVQQRLTDGRQRRRFWDTLLDGTWELPGVHFPIHETQVSALLDGVAADPEPVGEVTLVGCGPGDPELLTIKALRTLQQADVILHDRLLPAGILEYARRDAERIPVGKARGVTPVSQERIHQLLIDHARRGRRVVRLKGGDPFIFGRGGEEREALEAAGVPVRVIPGISAFQGCAASLGIPLTQRGRASRLLLLSGHDDTEVEGRDLARRDQTLVFYMGLARTRALCRRLIRQGLPGDWPALVIAQGSTENERRVHGQLDDLAERVEAAELTSPALLMVGPTLAREADDSATVPVARPMGA